MSGTLEVSQIATWEGASGVIGAPPLSPPPYVWDYVAPTWIGSIVGPGGSADLSWVIVENITGGPPYFETAKLYARETAGADTNDILISTGTATWAPAPTLEWTITWSTTGTHTSAHTQDQLNLFPFKQRYGNEQDDVSEVPNECHPLHFSMVYAWGSDDYDQDVTLGGASQLTEGLTLTPSVTTDGNGRPIAMTGTQDLTSVGITVGLTGTPKTGVTGTVVRWTGLQWSVGSFLGETIDLSEYSFTGSGITVTGGVGTLTLAITDAASVPGGGISKTATAKWPTGIDFDVDGDNWNTVYTGMEFTVPDDDGVGSQDVVRGYSASQVWHGNDFDGDIARVTSVAPTVASQWGSDNLENPTLADPDQDAECIIRERGLVGTLNNEGAKSDWEWGEFKARRRPSLSVQLPDDAGGVLPSAWIVTSGAATVVQAAKQTTITIDAAATDAIVRRTLAEDYFGYKVTSAGLTALGMPAGYQQTKHDPGDDIWHWGCYSALKLTYSSEAAQTVTLRIQNSTYDPADDHLTGGERVTNSVADGVRTQTEYTYTLSLVDTGVGTADIYIDLALPTTGADDPWLFHVDWMQFEDLDSDGGAEWDFVVEDLQLIEYSHTGTEETGKWDAKVSYARPVDDLPISYTGLTSTCDGSRAIMPPDQVVTLLGEAGLDFCLKLRGRASGNIEDALYNLAYWIGILSNTEGIEVDGAGTGISANGATEYDDVFVDADANDMLGGNLKASDVLEGFDFEVNTDAATSIIPTAVNVGKIYPCAGLAIDCRIRKHIRGQIHGPARLSTGFRPGSGAQVTLWEFNDPTWTKVSETTTDAWDRYWFVAGYRERLSGLAIAGATAPSVGNLTTVNKLRRWLEVIVPAPVVCRQVGRVTRWDGSTWFVWDDTIADGSYVIEGARTPDSGISRLPSAQIIAGRCPCMQGVADGGILMLFTKLASGIPEIRYLLWDGAEWSSDVAILTDVDCVGFDVSKFEGRLYVAGLVERVSGNDVLNDLYFWAGHVVGGIPVLNNTTGVLVIQDVEKATSCVRELADRSIHIAYGQSGDIDVATSDNGGATWSVVP